MRRTLRLGLILIACLTTAACALPYYWQAVGGQLSLMRSRIPLDEAMADPALPPATKERLERVVELRRFAAEELGLPDNGSYRSYVALDRDYVVWNVIAADAYSIDPVQWCFPVAGCVSYRGYFDRDAALEFERKLAAEGFDTYSGGAGAYSTLGYFDDPVLSTMIRRTDIGLAGVLFHELAHQRVYIKGDSELSEAFASAVEQYGVERWLRRDGSDERLAEYRSSRRRAGEFAALISAFRASLAVLYARDLDTTERAAGKAEVFERLEADYVALRDGWGGSSEFDGWFAGPMNNARLAAIATYRKWLPGLRWRLEEVGLEAFFTDIEGLAEQPQAERNATLEIWNAASASGSGADSGQAIVRRTEHRARDRRQALRLDAEVAEAVGRANARDTQ